MTDRKPSFTGVGERLRWAIEQRPADGRRRGVKLFQSDMRELSRRRVEEGYASVDGLSMPSILSYLPTQKRASQVVPDVFFLQAAAQVCGVRVLWLIYGEGYPTEAHEAAAKVSDTLVGADESKRADAFRMAAALLRALGVESRDVAVDALTSHFDVTDLWAPPEKVSLPHWLTTVAEIRLRLILSGAYNDLNPIGGTGPLTAKWIHQNIEHDIGRSLAAPLDAFRLSGGQLSARELDDFVALMLPALLHLTNCIARIGHNAVPDPGMGVDVTDAPAPKKSSRTRKSARTK